MAASNSAMCFRIISILSNRFPLSASTNRLPLPAPLSRVPSGHMWAHRRFAHVEQGTFLSHRSFRRRHSAHAVGFWCAPSRLCGSSSGRLRFMGGALVLASRGTHIRSETLVNSSGNLGHGDSHSCHAAIQARKCNLPPIPTACRISSNRREVWSVFTPATKWPGVYWWVLPRDGR